jgi:hypothetical protein
MADERTVDWAEIERAVSRMGIVQPAPVQGTPTLSVPGITGSSLQHHPASYRVRADADTSARGIALDDLSIRHERDPVEVQRILAAAEREFNDVREMLRRGQNNEVDSYPYLRPEYRQPVPTPGQASVFNPYVETLEKRIKLVAGTYLSNLADQDWHFPTQALAASERWLRISARFQVMSDGARAMHNFGQNPQTQTWLGQEAGGDLLQGIFGYSLRTEMDGYNDVLIGWAAKNNAALQAAVHTPHPFELPLDHKAELIEGPLRLPAPGSVAGGQSKDSIIVSGAFTTFKVPVGFLPLDAAPTRATARYQAPSTSSLTTNDTSYMDWFPGGTRALTDLNLMDRNETSGDVRLGAGTERMLVGFTPQDTAARIPTTPEHGGPYPWSGKFAEAYQDVFPKQVNAAATVAALCRQVSDALASLGFACLDYLSTLTSAVIAYYNFVLAAKSAAVTLTALQVNSAAAGVNAFVSALNGRLALANVPGYLATVVVDHMSIENAARLLQGAFSNYWSAIGIWLKSYAEFIGNQGRYVEEIVTARHALRKTGSFDIGPKGDATWYDWPKKGKSQKGPYEDAVPYAVAGSRIRLEGGPEPEAQADNQPLPYSPAAHRQAEALLDSELKARAQRGNAFWERTAAR